MRPAACRAARVERSLFAYGPDFESENPRVPAMPAEVRQALEAGATSAATTLDGDERVFAVGWRTPEGDGPATWILATSSIVAGINLSITINATIAFHSFSASSAAVVGLKVGFTG